jgi:hypothetical protein
MGVGMEVGMQMLAVKQRLQEPTAAASLMPGDRLAGYLHPSPVPRPQSGGGGGSLLDALEAKYGGGGSGGGKGKKRKSGDKAGVADQQEPTDEEFEAAQQRLAARKAGKARK